MNKIKLFLFALLMIVIATSIEKEIFAQCSTNFAQTMVVTSFGKATFAKYTANCSPNGTLSCTPVCTPFNDNFGTPSSSPCSGQQGAADAGMVNHCNYPCIGGPAIDDGEYRISCDGTNFNCGWKGGCSTPIQDNTTGTGYFAMINGVDNNSEFYHKTVTGLCSGGTYTFTFAAANASNYNSSNANDCGYSVPVNLTAYTFPAGTAVTAATLFSSTGATRTLVNTGSIFCTNTVGVVWTTYSATFTATATEQTNGLDLVLQTANGNGAGADFVVDDIKVTYVSGAGSCTGLPVGLMSFTAEKAPQNVLLKWSTETEENFSHFVVERSTDAVNFYQIGIVYGSGNSKHEIDYSYTDNSAVQGIVYYRLKQVDTDGKFKYSPVSNVNVDITSPVFIYPSDGDLTIQFTAKGEATYAVVDMIGKTIISGNRISEESTITISKSNFKTGVYIVKVQMGTEMVTKKVVLN
jgi:hypothetical protein